MSRTFPVVATLSALAAVAGLAGCAKNPPAQPASAALKQNATVREGTIADLEKNRMVFWDAQNPTGQPLALDLTDSTTVVDKGDFVNRKKLDEGEAVRVFFDETQPRPEALRVEILSGDEAKQIQKRVNQATGGK
jgi:hypothetical protein